MNNNLKMKFGFDVGVMVGWLWSQNTTTAVFLLSKTPTTLFVLWQGLWQEFEVGIGGRKPDRLVYLQGSKGGM